MKVKLNVILEAAIAAGIDSGYISAYEYDDDPSVYKIKQSIKDEIWEDMQPEFEYLKNIYKLHKSNKKAGLI